MAQDLATPPGTIDEILAWLNSDRDVAGQIYVQLRHDLAKIFTWNRCSDPEGLTDEVFDRVSRKVHQLRQTFSGDPRLFFYGVARNLIKEESKKIRAQVSLEQIDLAAANESAQNDNHPGMMRSDCLELCLQKISSDKRELVLDYYAKEKQAKIDHRAEIARRFGMSVEVLRVRIYRIRSKLERCIESCLDVKADRE
jgi:RNA polymerase sigma factor (sigma-70 family)